MGAPPLRIPLSLNMEDFQKNIESAKSITSSATQFIVKRFIDMNASLIATGGAAGSAVLGLRAILGVIGPLSVAIAGIVGVFKLMGLATELAKEKIEEFNEIAAQASQANISTDFFQRLTKSGEALHATVDDVVAALNRFNAVSTDKLGGSDLNKEVTKLSDFGNFKGNTGVSQLGGATDTETKLRATVALIDQAFESGQRLAALDIADKAFGLKIAENLRQDAGYLDQMLQTADKISAEKIISDDQIGQAIQLKTRLEDAQKVLAEKFKPIQDDLAKLGVNYHESWISVVETMSDAVVKANSLYDGLKRIPDLLADAGRSPFWSKLTELSGRLGLNSDPASLGLELPDAKGQFSATGSGSPANTALAAGLNNANAIRRAMQEASDIQSKVRGDTSKGPPEKAESDSRDQFETSIDQITKHIATINADTAAVFANKSVQAQLRAEFQELQAIQRDGGEVTQAQIDQYEKLRQSMTAQQALDAAGITLTKEHAAAFQSSATAIGAATARYDAATASLNKINSASQQIGSALSTAFADAVVEGKNLNDVFSSLIKTLEKAAINSVFSSIFNAPASGGLSPFASLFSGLIPKFAGGTDNAPGGAAWVGENGPEIVNLPRGAQVVPNAIAAKSSGGGTSITYQIDASGADSGTVARIQYVLQQHSKAIIGTNRALGSAQRMQTSGVG